MMSKDSCLPLNQNCTIAVIGLGYVGLPLAVEFARTKVCAKSGNPLNRKVIGYDISSQRLEQLRRGIDTTKEISASELKQANSLNFTNERRGR